MGDLGKHGNDNLMWSTSEQIVQSRDWTLTDIGFLGHLQCAVCSIYVLLKCASYGGMDNMKCHGALQCLDEGGAEL